MDSYPLSSTGCKLIVDYNDPAKSKLTPEAIKAFLLCLQYTNIPMLPSLFRFQ
jgi:hypothetical protein